MNIKNIFFGIMAALLLVNMAATYYINRKVEKIIVVDVLRVFNEFSLKKEVEQKVDARLRLYKSKIDSLQAIAQQAERNKDEARIVRAREVMGQLQQELQTAVDVSAKNINETVWKRLNPLIDEFGKKYHYRLIIGANGMGTVLYNEEADDKTDELIQFINKRYETGS